MKVNVSAGSIGTQNNADVIHIGGDAGEKATEKARRSTEAPARSDASTTDVFVSHSSRDAALAEAVVDLLSRALLMGASAVRCTSVDGYRLTAGSVVGDALRRDIKDARVFVALLTPASMASPYVLFELGARWGQGTPFLPLMARGWSSSSLQAPLAELSCLDLRRRGEVEQLVADVAKLLERPIQPSAVYVSAVDRVLAAAGEPTTQ